MQRRIVRQKNVKNVKALRNNFCFGKALSSKVITSTTRETQKQQLNSVYNKFSCYITRLIVISEK